MKHCTVCGMEMDANPAHGANFKGVGQHAFSEEESVFDDIIVSFGGELKSLGGGKFEGYLVRYSNADDPDLVGDYFTKSTQFFVDDGATIPLLYDHGLNPTMQKAKIGRATVKYDDEGLFIKGELETAENYKKFLKEIKTKLMDSGKAGLSSGAASHMVERKQIKKGINEITSWGIAEGSITPAPTEPRCEVVSLKSYFDLRTDPMSSEDEEAETKTIKKENGKFVLYTADGSKVLGTHPTKQDAIDQEVAIEASKKKKMGMGKSVDEDSEEPEEELAAAIERPLKALFEDKLKEKAPSVWELRSTLDDVYRDIAMAASITEITDTIIDVETKVKEAKTEEAAREIPIVVAQINKWVEGGGSTGDGCGGSKYFYLRSLDTDLEEGIKGGLGNGLTLDEHSDKVVNAIEEYANLGASLFEEVKAFEERCKKKIEYRAKDPIKSGRTLSKATVEKLADIQKKNQDNLTASQQLGESLNNLLSLAAEPKKVADAAEILQMEFALTRNQTALALEGHPVS